MTAKGSKPEAFLPPRHVRCTLKSRRRQAAPAGPKTFTQPGACTAANWNAQQQQRGVI